jgi:cell division protein FtsQ
MPGNYIFSEDVLPAETAVSSKFEKTLKRLIVIAALILTAELVWLLVISPCMPLSKIEIAGFQELERAAVLEKAGINPQSSYLSVDAKTVERALGSMPRIESARVIKQFPDTVMIILEQRKAVALSLAEVNGRLLPLFFDRHGVVFKIGNGGAEALSLQGAEALSPALPVLSGLIFEQPALGMRLPVMFTSLLADLETIKASAPELLGAVSEIRINRKTFDRFDLILYPVHKPVRIRVDAELNENMLRYTLLMVDVLVSQDPGIGEIDFRAGMASYTIKEVPSGQ